MILYSTYFDVFSSLDNYSLIIFVTILYYICNEPTQIVRCSARSIRSNMIIYNNLSALYRLVSTSSGSIDNNNNIYYLLNNNNTIRSKQCLEQLLSLVMIVVIEHRTRNDGAVVNDINNSSNSVIYR